MKGVVVTELFEMVETEFGADLADELSQACEVDTAEFVAVDEYDHTELLRLMTALGELIDRSPAQVGHSFGDYLFARHAESYPQAVTGDLLDFLGSIDSHLHSEIRRLHGDDVWPTFETDRNQNAVRINYCSPLALGDVIEGMLSGCCAHFGVDTKLVRQDSSEGIQNFAEFTVTPTVAHA